MESENATEREEKERWRVRMREKKNVKDRENTPSCQYIRITKSEKFGRRRNGAGAINIWKKRYERYFCERG